MNPYIEYYFQANFVLLVLAIATLLVPTAKYHKNDQHAFFIKAAVCLFIILSVFNTIEHFASLPESLVPIRYVSTSAGYILRPAIILMLCFGIRRMGKWDLLILIPLGVNALLVILSCFTGVVFRFDEANSFHRGPMGLFPHIVSFIYLAYLFVVIFFTTKDREIFELFPIFFIAFAGLVAVILEVANVLEGIFDGTMVIGCLFDLVYLTIYYSKRDSLTGLLNHRMYYSDAMRRDASLTAVVSMDMNGLKFLNDNYGHEAGDKGLITLANCFLLESNRKMKIYRVGGDEFSALCFEMSELEVKQAIERIYSYVAKTEYTCAIGYHYRKENEPFNEMFHDADMDMYEAKKEFYSKHNRREEKQESK